MPIRFEKQYCDACMCAHWVQVVSRDRLVCHGRDYIPTDSPTHYTRWRYGGIELCEKVNARAVQPVTDWIFAEAERLEREHPDEFQDW